MLVHFDPCINCFSYSRQKRKYSAHTEVTVIYGMIRPSRCPLHKAPVSSLLPQTRDYTSVFAQDLQHFHSVDNEEINEHDIIIT